MRRQVPLLPRLADPVRETLKLFRCEFRVRDLRQGHHRLLRRPRKKGLEQVLKRRAPRPLGLDLGEEDVPRPFLAMPDVSLLLQDPEGGPPPRRAVPPSSIERAIDRGNQGVRADITGGRESV